MSPDSKGRILVVDDEEGVKDLLCIMLRRCGYETEGALSGEEALENFRKRPADVVLQDVRMPGMDGIQLLRSLKEIDPDVLVIIMTAFSTWSTAVEAMRLGAYNYIKKPFDNDAIRDMVGRALEHARRLHAPEASDQQAGLSLRMIVGNTPQMQEVFRIVRRIAPTDSTVLIQGESGTGKELIARLVHLSSLRAESNFIAVSCSAFPESLLESELFGHMRGAFTGATNNKKGLLEVADAGTFFLDEVGDISPQMQVKLLRVLEEREIRPVGSTETKKVDVRLISATNRNLEEEVKNGNFREDLFFRLNVIPITLPPLRERRDDIPLLAGFFLARYAAAMKKNVKGFDPMAIETLVHSDWPGNIRELENVVQRAVAMSQGDQILLADLFPNGERQKPPADFLGELPAEGLDLQKRLEQVERHYIEQALARTSGHIGKAAEILGMTFRSIRYRIEKLGIQTKT
jgi:two-component system response regulator PilR (NtrC family)